MASGNTTQNTISPSLYEDLQEMMFGFGDDWPPDHESIVFLEKLVTEYVEDFTYRALQLSEITGTLDKECFMYLVRKDRRKFNRIHQLLTSNEEIQNVKNSEDAEYIKNDESKN